MGGSNFNAPAQTVGSFLGQADAPSVESSIHSYEPHIVDCDLHQCLPDYVSSVLERPYRIGDAVSKALIALKSV